MAFYSPKRSYPDGERYQMFTAIGVVRTGEIYQVDMGGGFTPFRVDVRFFKAKEVEIRPLLPKLSFIRDQAHWGTAFRFGHLKIAAKDFEVIAAAMGRDFQRDFVA